jgi:hypothetical protein
MLDPQTGASQWLAANVASYGLVVSPDSQRVGFISDVVSPPPGCTERGTAQVADRAGKTTLVSPEAVNQSLQFLSGSILLYGIQPTCSDLFHGFQLVACDLSAGTCTLVGSPHEYGYAFHLSERRYATSPDGKLVLGANSDPQGIKNQLLAIRTDGSGEQVIAGDLFPFSMVSAIFDAWTFTKSGKHVVYTRLASSELPPYTMGLTAVSPSGGPALSFTSGIFSAAYQISPTREEVAYIGYDKSGMHVELGFIDTGAVVQPLSSPHQLGTMRYLSDGRGLLLLEHYKKPANTRLHYVSRDGASTQVLGQWSQSLLSSRYQVDHSGCVVLYDTDTGDAGGTHLALLP